MKIIKKPEINSPDISSDLLDLALVLLSEDILIKHMKKNVKYLDTQSRKISPNNFRVINHSIENSKTELIFKFKLKIDSEVHDLVVRENKEVLFRKVVNLLNEHYMTDPDLKEKVKDRIKSFFKHYYPNEIIMLLMWFAI